MYDIRKGSGCGIRATLLTASGAVCDLRSARYIGARLVLPSGATMPCEDLSYDETTNAVYVKLLAERELTTVGTYGIVFNVKIDRDTTYATNVVSFAEVKENAEKGYRELTLSFSLTVADFPNNVAYTGASPKISDRNTWLVYDDQKKAYVDTGVDVGYAVMQDQIDKLRTPSGSPLHDLFVAAGAVWNPSSKSWTVGSVTGISNSVMTRIYSLSHNVLNNSNWDSVLESTDIPVNLPPRKSPSRTSSSIQTTARSTFRASNFNTIYLCPNSQYVRFSDCSQMFYGCQQLVTIIGGIIFENTANNLAFTSCKSLQDVRFNQLRYNIDLRNSPLLTLESFQYLVENATNTSAITVTVHADVYAKLTDPQQADWYAVNTAAQGKQISFATA